LRLHAYTHILLCQTFLRCLWMKLSTQVRLLEKHDQDPN
jgi:hypothetical protein